MKVNLFNNFIAFGAGYIKSDYSSKYFQNSLMIIGYPNKSDKTLDIIDYIKNYEYSISNIKINLTEGMRIENNIFEYKYKCIKFNNIYKSGNIYLEYNGIIIDDLINSKIYEPYILKIRNSTNNSYLESHYNIEYSMIVTESDYQEYDKYPIEIINYIGYETSERFNDNKNEYIGKSIYYDIILKENLTTACGNPRCLICYEKDYECISLKSEEESEVLTTKEKYKDLEILYTTIIIAGASIIPFFYCYSFQNLRIFFLLFKLLFFV